MVCIYLRVFKTWVLADLLSRASKKIEKRSLMFIIKVLCSRIFMRFCRISCALVLLVFEQSDAGDRPVIEEWKIFFFNFFLVHPPSVGWGRKRRREGGGEGRRRRTKSMRRQSEDGDVWFRFDHLLTSPPMGEGPISFDRKKGTTNERYPVTRRPLNFIDALELGSRVLTFMLHTLVSKFLTDMRAIRSQTIEWLPLVQIPSKTWSNEIILGKTWWKRTKLI